MLFLDYTGFVFQTVSIQKRFIILTKRADEVIFEGYCNDEEERYTKLYLQCGWRKQGESGKGRTK